MALKRILRGAALVAFGGAATLVATQVHVTIGHPAQAAPPAGMQPNLPPPSPSQVADARAISRTFAQVAEQLKPSVVSIIVEKRMQNAFFHGRRGPGGMHGRNPFEGTPFAPFFGFPDGEGGDEAPSPKQVGAGSGMVIDARGFVLTNNHVVEGADVIKVRFADGKESKAKIVGTDPKTDIAVIKVEKADRLVAARLGDSDQLAVGEWVIAIGNPYGFDHTVTVGVVSAKGRFGIGAGPYEDFIQTDAAINPGNSGGPLVNLDGEVVGINTAIRGIGTMIGFAIPSNMAKPVAGQLMNGGKVHRSYLGIHMQNVTEELAAGLGQGAPSQGALVDQVEKGSPAERAGVQQGDVIVRVDGAPMDGSKAVQRAVIGKPVGQALRIEAWRAGKTVPLEARTAENPSDKGGEAQGGEEEGGPDERGKLGLQLQTLTPPLAQQLGIEGAGAAVAGVRPGSPAEEAGVREGDVIVEVDRKKVTNADEVVRALHGKRAGGHLLLLKRRDGEALAQLFLVVPSA
jgi:serine protease Do